FAAVVLKQNVGIAVAVEIADRPLVPGGAGVARSAAAGNRRAADHPEKGLAAVVLQEDTGAVALPRQIDIARQVGAAVAGDVPDSDLAVVVLNQKVGEAVIVEDAGADRIPARPGTADRARREDAFAFPLPHRYFAAVVLKQDVGAMIAVEIAGADRVPARPRV